MTPAAVLSIDVQEDGGTVVLILRGDLDASTIPAFVERVRRYDPAEVQMVIDLAGVGVIDSAGLRALIDERNRAHRAGARLGLVCPDPRLVRLFWFTGLRPAFVFGDDLAAVRSAMDARGTAPHARGRVAMTIDSRDRGTSRPRPPGRSGAPASETCGVLVLIAAITQDATCALARIERQLAAAPDDAAALRHGRDALAAVERTGHLLQIQRETLVERLTVLAVEAAEPGRRGSRRLEAAGLPVATQDRS